MEETGRKNTKIHAVDDRNITCTFLESRLVWKDRIKQNMVYLTDNLVPDSLILPLKERDLIGTNQWNRLHDLSTHEKTAMLIDIVYRGHPELFDGFIEELMKDGQTAIAKRLTSKGNSAWRIPSHFKSNLTNLSTNLRFEGAFLASLQALNVIPLDRIEKIKAKSTRADKAELLLRFLEKGLDEGRITGFVTALEETGQKHLAALLKTGDSSLLVPAEIRQILVGKKYELTKAMASRGPGTIGCLASYLAQEESITKPQLEWISTRETAYDQAEELIDILPMRPYTGQHQYLMNCVKQSSIMPTDPTQRKEQGFDYTEATTEHLPIGFQGLSLDETSDAQPKVENSACHWESQNVPTSEVSAEDLTKSWLSLADASDTQLELDYMARQAVSEDLPDSSFLEGSLPVFSPEKHQTSTPTKASDGLVGPPASSPSKEVIPFDQKRNTCDECGKRYTPKKDLTTQTDEQYGLLPEFKCDKCLKVYKHSTSLNRHKDIEHNICHPHICDICNLPYKYKSSLNRHISQKHLSVL